VGRAPPARSVTTDRPIMVRGIYITANDKVMEQAGCATAQIRINFANKGVGLGNLMNFFTLIQI